MCPEKGYKNASFLICYNQNLDITQTFIKGDLIKNCAYNNHYSVIKFSNEWQMWKDINDYQNHCFKGKELRPWRILNTWICLQELLKQS